MIYNSIISKDKIKLETYVVNCINSSSYLCTSRYVEDKVLLTIYKYYNDSNYIECRELKVIETMIKLFCDRYPTSHNVVIDNRVITTLNTKDIISQYNIAVKTINGHRSITNNNTVEFLLNAEQKDGVYCYSDSFKDIPKYEDFLITDVKGIPIIMRDTDKGYLQIFNPLIGEYKTRLALAVILAFNLEDNIFIDIESKLHPSMKANEVTEDKLRNIIRRKYNV